MHVVKKHVGGSLNLINAHLFQAFYFALQRLDRGQFFGVFAAGSDVLDKFCDSLKLR